MKRFVISSLVAGIVAVGLVANAEEAAPAAPAAPVEKAVKKEKAPPPPAIDINLTGTLKKVETVKQDKKTGKEVKQVRFELVLEDGSAVKLSAPRAKKGEAMPAINLDALVDKKVKVVGKGFEKVDKKGVKTTVFKEITSAEEVAAPAAQ